MDLKRTAGVLLVVVGLGVLVFAMFGRSNGSYREGWQLDVSPTPGSNVVLVTIDTTRADHLGCYGGAKDVTPFLNDLATQGVVLEQAQAVAPITLPSHASMLSGLYPSEHGIRNNGLFALPEDIETLPHVFGDAGYATAAFVSAAVLARRYGLDRDFDVYDDDLSLGLHLRQGSVPARRGDITVGAAMAWLNSLPADKPFFVWVHLYDPHAPYDPPSEFRRRYPNDAYTAEIAFADSQVGRLLDFLDERGIADQTYISVIADHGEALGEHGESTHALLLHQATIHVPWILSGPGIPHGARISSPVSGIDVAPTLAELVGLQPPNADRTLARPAFARHPAGSTIDQDRPIYFETLLPKYQYGWKELEGIRLGSMELIRGTRDEVFDLFRDPRELIDIADRRPEDRDALSRALEPFVLEAREGDGAADARIQLSRAEMEQLRELGYLGTTDPGRAEPPDPRDLVSAHVLIEKARALQGQGMLVEAAQALDKTLEEDPTNISALGMRATIFLRMQDYDRAKNDITSLMTIDPDSADAYMKMAQLELAQAHFQRALDLADLGSTKRGAFEELSVLQARALVGLGRMDDAEQLIVDRLQLHPDDPDLLSTRARFLEADGNDQEAEALLRRAVQVDALHVNSRFMLANLLRRQGRTDEAVVLLEELLQIQPGNPRVLAAIGGVKDDDPEEARVYLEEAVRLDPSNGIAIVNLGQAYLRLNQPDKAEAMLRRGLELIPDRLPVRNNLAVALMLQGKAEESERELREILQKNPRFTEARNNLSLALYRQKKYDEAEKQARQALGEAPQLVDASVTLAEILLATDRAKLIPALLGPIYEGGDDRPQLVRLLGIGRSRAGDAEGALPLLEAAVAQNDADGYACLEYAKSLEAVGQSGKARRMYERAAQILPPGDDRQYALDSIQRIVLQ